MILQCPRCQTKYRLDEKQISPNGTTVHCSNCDHTFTAQPPAPSAPPAPEPTPAPPPGEEDEIDFSFLDEAGPAAGAEDMEKELGARAKGRRGKGMVRWIVAAIIIIVLIFGATIFLKTRGVHLDKRYAGFDLFEVLPFFESAVPETPEAPPEADETAEPAEMAETAASSETAERAETPASPPAAQEAEEVSDPGNMRINLEEVAGRFLDAGDNGRAFIVQGKIKNAYGEPVSEIMLRVLLHTQTQREAAFQTAYAGNVFSDLELADLSKDIIRALLMNPKGQGDSNFNVAPGEMVDFMIVIFNLPDNLSEYTVEVLASKRGLQAD